MMSDRRSLLVTMMLCTGLPGVARAHPGQIRQAAHNTQAYIDEQTITVRYQLRLPLAQVQGTHGHPFELIGAELMDGWLLEIDGVYVPWSIIEPLETFSKSQSLEAVIALRAPIASWPVNIRLSNANLIDTPGFFSNGLYLGSNIRVERADPDLIPNTGQRANLSQTWTMDPDSREWRVSLKKEITTLQSLHQWATDAPQWVLADGTPKPGITTSWSRGLKTTALTICSAFMCFAMGTLAECNTPKPKENILPFTFWCILSMFFALVVPASWPYLPIFGIALLTAGACGGYWDISRQGVPVMASVGIAFTYGAPKLALFGLIPCLLLAFTRGTRQGAVVPTWCFTGIFGILSLLGFWRMF